MRQIVRIIVALIVIMLPSELLAGPSDKSYSLEAENSQPPDAVQDNSKGDLQQAPHGEKTKKKKSSKKSSAKERKKKKAEITAGLEYLNVPGVSGSAGLYLTPNILLEAGGFYGAFSFFNNGVSYWEGQGDIKYFVWKTVYAKVGCGYGQLTASHSSSLLSSEGAWSEGVSVVRGFGAVGSQWQWRHFTIGADVLNVGYNYAMSPVTNNIPLDSSGNPTLTGDDAKSSLSGVSGGITIGGKFFLGFAF